MVIYMPVSIFHKNMHHADMAELADAPDLGSGGNTRAGSSPVIRTYNSRSSKGVIFIVRHTCYTVGSKCGKDNVS